MAKGRGRGRAKGKDKGKGRKPKKTLEESGWALQNGLRVRAPRLRCALHWDVRTSTPCHVEIGNLEEETAGSLPDGSAELEVLCNRQTLFGNPFSMVPLIGKGKRPPRCSEDEARERVCEAFEKYLSSVLEPGADGSLSDLAELTVQDDEATADILDREWASNFGQRSCEEYRAAYEALVELVTSHPAGVRLLCHCAPLRCHTQSIADRLFQAGVQPPPPIEAPPAAPAPTSSTASKAAPSDAPAKSGNGTMDSEGVRATNASPCLLL